MSLREYSDDDDWHFPAVPRYLFRTSSPGSDGTATASMASRKGLQPFTLASLGCERGGEMLMDHVLWRSWRKRNDDILLSFTSSLLFAIQHAIRKCNKDPRTSHVNCMISVVDTAAFPEGTFDWTPELLDRYMLDERDDPDLLYKYHEAEYLVEYELKPRNGAMITVSLERLMKHGLLEIVMPRLETNSLDLARAVDRARDQWYGQPVDISRAELKAARKFGKRFGGKWLLPMMIWALAFKNRSSNDLRMKLEFEDDWHGDLPEPSHSHYQVFNPPEQLKELCQWHKLMETVRQIKRSVSVDTIDTGDEIEVASMGIQSLVLG